MGQNLILECLSRTLRITNITLAPSEVLVGRSSDCDLYIPDLTISRRHAKIAMVSSVVTVVDLGSRNGTFVEEEQVTSSVLQIGQILRFGAVYFRLTDGNVSEKEVRSEISTFEAPIKHKPSTDLTTVALSPAQRRVLDLLLKGLGERDVADQLHISHHTVHNHAREIYRIIRVHSRAELLSRLLPSHKD